MYMYMYIYMVTFFLHTFICVCGCVYIVCIVVCKYRYAYIDVYIDFLARVHIFGGYFKLLSEIPEYPRVLNVTWGSQTLARFVFLE